MRGLKDQSIVLAAIAHNLTTLPRTWGAEDAQEITEDSYRQVINRLRQEERRQWGLLLREHTGLPQETRKELDHWDRMFHVEVHGSKLSHSRDMVTWSRGEGEPSIGPISPKPSDSAWGNYMNRAVEVGWLIVRLLPYLQPTETAFGEEWQWKHEILDDSFRFSEQVFSESRKEFGEAFIEFVDAKFSFRKPFYYSEADGSGPHNSS